MPLSLRRLSRASISESDSESDHSINPSTTSDYYHRKRGSISESDRGSIHSMEGVPGISASLQAYVQQGNNVSTHYRAHNTSVVSPTQSQVASPNSSTGPPRSGSPKSPSWNASLARKGSGDIERISSNEQHRANHGKNGHRHSQIGMSSSFGQQKAWFGSPAHGHSHWGGVDHHSHHSQHSHYQYGNHASNSSSPQKNEAKNPTPSTSGNMLSLSTSCPNLPIFFKQTTQTPQVITERRGQHIGTDHENVSVSSASSSSSPTRYNAQLHTDVRPNSALNRRMYEKLGNMHAGASSPEVNGEFFFNSYLLFGKQVC